MAGDYVSIQGQSTTQTTTAGGKPLAEPIKSTSNNLHVAEQGNITGLRNPSSGTNAYLATYRPANVTILDGTSAVTIGGGAANDTHLLGVLIPKNAGPATCTLTGFGKATSGTGTYTAKDIVLTGSTADDRYYDFGGAINNVAALTATGSVDEIVVVFWRPA